MHAEGGGQQPVWYACAAIARLLNDVFQNHVTYLLTHLRACFTSFSLLSPAFSPSANAAPSSAATGRLLQLAYLLQWRTCCSWRESLALECYSRRPAARVLAAPNAHVAAHARSAVELGGCSHVTVSAALA